MKSEHAVPDSGAVLVPATAVAGEQPGTLVLDYRNGVPVLTISGGRAMPATLLLVNGEEQVLGRYEAVLHQPVMRAAGYLGFAKATPGVTDESPVPPMVVSEGTDQADPVVLREVLDPEHVGSHPHPTEISDRDPRTRPESDAGPW